MAGRLFFLLGLCALTLGLSLGTAAQTGDSATGPVLRIETGMHGAIVNRIALADQGRQLVTVSDDKTVRLWSLATGAAQGVWRTPIGAGDRGALYAVAANGDTVAAGGLTAETAAEKKALYLFNRRTGALLGSIRGFANAIIALAFSPDGHYLAVGEQGPRGLTVIDVRAGKEAFHDRDYGDTISWLAFAPDGRLASTSADGRVRLYENFSAKPVAATLPASGGTRDQPWGVVFSPDGTRLAVGSRHEAKVHILSATGLKPLAVLGGGAGKVGSLSVVAWSADGAGVAAAGGYEDSAGRHFARIFSLAAKSAKDVAVATDFVTDLAFRPDGTLAFASAEPAFGLVDPAAGMATVLQGRRQSDFRDANDRFRVSNDGAAVEFPSRQGGKNLYRFDLTDGTLVRNPAPSADLKPPSLASSRLTVTGGAAPKLNGRPIRLEKGDLVRAVAMNPAGDAVLLGTEYYLQLEFADGQSWRKVLPAPAWAVNVSGNGRYAIAGLGDGTIRWFSMVGGDEVMAAYVDPHDDRWVAWLPEGFFDHSAARGKVAGGEALVGYQIGNGPNKLADFVDDGQLYSLFYRRDLVLDRIRRGPLGAQNVGVQLAKIGDVRAVLHGGLPPRLQLIEACILPKGANACVADRAVRPAQKTDRAIEIPGPGETLLVRYRVEDRGSGFGHVIVRRGGAVIAAPLAVESSEAHARIERALVKLRPQDDEIRLASETGNRSVQSPANEDLRVHVTAETAWVITGDTGEAIKPQLYLVAVGVSRYQVPDFALDNAANDAKAVASLFGPPSPPVYDSAHVTLLLDSDATTEKISAALAGIVAKARPQDIVVLFFSGHGEAVDGKYYFAPVDFAAKDAGLIAEAKTAPDERRAAIYDDLFRREGYGETQLVPVLKKIQGNLLLVLDTCFSGTIATGDAVESRARNQTVTNSVGRETGRFILAGARRLAADSAGAENGEKYGGHGLFTTFLLTGLEGGADPLHSGQIEVDELLKFTQARVREESRAHHFEQEPAFFFSGSNFFAVRAVATAAQK